MAQTTVLEILRSHPQGSTTGLTVREVEDLYPHLYGVNVGVDLHALRKWKEVEQIPGTAPIKWRLIPESKCGYCGKLTRKRYCSARCHKRSFFEEDEQY